MGLGLTFDTGALVALERRHQRMADVLARARALHVPITVPAPVVAEWWRGQRGRVADILRGVHVEPLAAPLARIAGEALAKTGGSNAVDAIVMASAAQRGDVVFTSDLDDLEALGPYFPGVKVLRA